MRERAAVARDYEFGLLDADTKREIRRAVLKAVAIPGYQTPYASRELPIGRGFGTGALQVTLSLLGSEDALKVIDQGSDDSVNAVNLKEFVARVCPGVGTTTKTGDATVIQSRHRIPERPLGEEQILVLQVPYPDPLVLIEANERARQRMHSEADYAGLYVKLYEDLVQFSEISISHRYPTRIHGHYIIDPSPIPRFDIPKLHRRPSLTIFAAGREKKIYAVPPFTRAEPIVFDDIPFRAENLGDSSGIRRRCSLCGSRDSFLDQVEDRDEVLDTCSDTDFCEQTRRETRR